MESKRGRLMGINIEVEKGDLLAPEQGRRLQELQDVQACRSLTSDERAELKILVAAYGRHLHEQGLRDLARQRDSTIDQVRAEAMADLDRAQTWWREVQADPTRLEQLVNEAMERQQERIRTAG